MTDNMTVYLHNAMRLERLSPGVRRLVPEFDTQEELSEYLDKSGATLEQMSAQEEAIRLGYLPERDHEDE